MCFTDITKCQVQFMTLLSMYGLETLPLSWVLQISRKRKQCCSGVLAPFPMLVQVTWRLALNKLKL